MRDTPQTDAAVINNGYPWPQPLQVNGNEVVPADFARELERRVRELEAEVSVLRVKVEVRGSD